MKLSWRHKRSYIRYHIRQIASEKSSRFQTTWSILRTRNPEFSNSLCFGVAQACIGSWNLSVLSRVIGFLTTNIQKQGRCCKYERQLLGLDICVANEGCTIHYQDETWVFKTCLVLKCAWNFLLIVQKRYAEFQLRNAIVLLDAILVVLKLGSWILAYWFLENRIPTSLPTIILKWIVMFPGTDVHQRYFQKYRKQTIRKWWF